MDNSERKQKKLSIRDYADSKKIITTKSSNDWIFDVVIDQLFLIVERKTEDINRLSLLKKTVHGLHKELRNLEPEANLMETVADVSRKFCSIEDFIESSSRVLVDAISVESHFVESTKSLLKGIADESQIFFDHLSSLQEYDAKKNKLEKQIHQAQKMESVGQLAGGVAHDFNNMLGIILGHTELALDRVGQDHPVSTDLLEIRKAAERSADFTRQLLAFASRQTIIPKVVDLNVTVAGMFKMLKRLICEYIELIWIPGVELWPVKVDPSQIDQVLANLCVNARDAIGGAGKIIIETQNIAVDDAYCEFLVDSSPGDYVLLTVSDNGCGMSKETLSNIFEPFFTTKEIGRGTGLGLATVHGIVKQNNGFISVYSEQNKGTTFKIYLQRHKGNVEPIKKEISIDPTAYGNQTILLVEDEPSILKMTMMMLQGLGYTVLSTSSPREAIHMAESHPDAIHLLMTDVVMPEMDGKELSQNILRHNPNLKCLFMSGYTANIIADHGILGENVKFIQKPFSRKDLAANVRECMNDDQGS